MNRYHNLWVLLIHSHTQVFGSFKICVFLLSKKIHLFEKWPSYYSTRVGLINFKYMTSANNIRDNVNNIATHSSSRYFSIFFIILDIQTISNKIKNNMTPLLLSFSCCLCTYDLTVLRTMTGYTDVFLEFVWTLHATEINMKCTKTHTLMKQCCRSIFIL